MITRAPTSVMLNGILGEAPAEHVTLAWLAGRLGHRSFGVILLLLALLGVLPGVSAMAGVLLTIVAFQMILDRPGPAFPPHRHPSCRDPPVGCDHSPSRSGAALPGAVHPPALGRPVHGNQAGGWRCRSVAWREPPRSRPPEQPSPGAAHCPNRLRLSGGGRRAALRRAGRYPPSVRDRRAFCP